MPHYRATIRYGSPPRYHVVNVEAATLRAAIGRIAGEFPPDAEASADLLELRLRADPDSREFTPG